MFILCLFLALFLFYLGLTWIQASLFKKLLQEEKELLENGVEPTNSSTPHGMVADENGNAHSIEIKI